MRWKGSGCPISEYKLSAGDTREEIWKFGPFPHPHALSMVDGEDGGGMALYVVIASLQPPFYSSNPAQRRSFLARASPAMLPVGDQEKKKGYQKYEKEICNPNQQNTPYVGTLHE